MHKPVASRSRAFVQDTRHARTHTFSHVHVRKCRRVRVAFNDTWPTMMTKKKGDAAKTSIAILIVVTSLSNRILRFQLGCLDNKLINIL